MCRDVEGILVHEYGAHIFHTSNEEVWKYVTSLAEFNHYINCPVANYHGETYNLPFNMNTFSKMWELHFLLRQRDHRIPKTEGGGRAFKSGRTGHQSGGHRHI